MEEPWIGVLRDCNVRYRGRAKAEQHGGTLAILVKGDGAVVAHSLDEGVSSQFYNPGGETNWWTRLDRLYIESESKEGEVLKINGLPELTHPVDEGRSHDKPPRRYIEGLENDLAEWISSNPSLLDLEGAAKEREDDRIGGRVDLVFDGGWVVEVKRQATVSAHDQARRYLRDPEVEKVMIACFDASENLARACEDQDDIEVSVLDETEFEEWIEDRPGPTT